MAPAEPLQVALQVASALERCGVRYLVGGSLASSVSGEPRSTGTGAPATVSPISSSATARVVLDYTSDSGYSDWAQFAAGTIVIADYSSDSYENINAGGPQPMLKAYRVGEEGLE